MDKVKIILENGIEKEVDGIFYLFNSKYYFIYTEKEIDQNGYVVLHLVQVGKEVKNTAQGTVDTGYMIGVEISDQNEWGQVQQSITKIVEDKKNNTQSEGIQYLPINMLNTLKILSSKTFRLMKNIVIDNFKINLVESKNNNEELIVKTPTEQLESIPNTNIQTEQTQNNIETQSVQANNPENNIQNKVQETQSYQQGQPTNYVEQDNDVIIDYRSRFFEEQEKNIELQSQVEELTKKIENIKQIIG